MTIKEIDYLLDLLSKKKEHLQDQHKIVLKSKQFGINHVNKIIEAMETNNSLIVQLERMKKEVDNGLLGFNH